MHHCCDGELDSVWVSLPTPNCVSDSIKRDSGRYLGADSFRNGSTAIQELDHENDSPIRRTIDLRLGRRDHQYPADRTVAERPRAGLVGDECDGSESHMVSIRFRLGLLARFDFRDQSL